MVLSSESALDIADIEIADVFVKECDDVVVYGDMERETILHEGGVRVLANGWVELPTGRLLSPSAVHHIDEKPDADN